MGTLQLVLPANLHAFTIAASSEAAAYPATNAKLLGRPFRVARTTATGTQWWRADQAAAAAVQALVLSNVNFPTAAVETSADASTWAAVTGSPFTIPIDLRVGRRKAFLALTSVNARYLRVLPSGTPDGGATYFECGGLALASAVSTFDRNPSDFRLTVQGGETVTVYRGGGREVNVEGRPFLRYRFAKDVWRRAVGNERGLLEQMALLDAGQPLVLFENNGDVSQVYVCGRTERDDVVIASPRHFGTGMTFEEFI